MKIITVMSKAYPFAGRGQRVFPGGAQITCLSFLKALAEKYGHRCTLLTHFPARQTARYGPVAIASFRDPEELRQSIERLRPDVIHGALGLSYAAVRLGERLGIPTLVYHHSYELCPPMAHEVRSWGIRSTENWLGPSEIRFVQRHAVRSLACSHYLRDHIRKSGGICHKTVYPEFDTANVVIGGRRQEAGEFISGVCGYAYKGAKVFLKLARSFPRERFLLVGNVDPSLRDRFDTLENISVSPPLSAKQWLRESKLVLVPSRWPEPFGRVAVEAMANGIPVLVSATGGLPEAATDDSLQVHSFPQVDSWRDELGALLASESARKANGERGCVLARRFLGGRSSEMFEAELRRAAGRGARRRRDHRVAALCGSKSAKTAYSLVNQHWSREVGRRAALEVIELEKPGDFCPLPVDVFVHHDYQQDFGSVTAPSEGKFVAVRTWDFGPFPPAWVEKVNAECDQLWVHSRWVRENAVRSGIPASKVRVTPLGFDERVFRPRGSAFRLSTTGRFRFLFVGATVVRKGIDILLDAYAEAFGPTDDVCLVIKDNPRDVFYTGIDYRGEIRKRMRSGSSGKIVYLDRYLEAAELACLYRACDVGVFPYRAEGFCLPILEAMACGVPSIVPRFGASLDYCTPANSFPVEVKRISLPVTRQFAINTLGFEEELREVDFCEVPVGVLAAKMREVYEQDRKEIRVKGRAAAERAHREFRWEHAVAKIHWYLEELDRVRTPVRFRRQRALRAGHRQTFNVARELFLERMRPVAEEGERKD